MRFEGAVMRQYQYQVTIEPDNKSSVKIIDDAGGTVGYIEKDVLRK